ncbi:MAG TPA: glycoside hydrolase family 2 TIM barrel-domain containing protein, partial [Pyrinomonadaceae bacterium]|nr:glycoside hydrolase family 2 TIM barrel-domain containing protein [Pyrinomonadaceae bacterium]
NDKLKFAGQRAVEPGRLVLPMNRNWRFSAERVANDTARDFNDSRFDLVTIPHPNKKLPWHSFDEKSYQFVSSFRRRFKLPREAYGRQVFVDFEGAMTASTVWINGQRLGEYKGGYTPFTFELTQHVDWDRENVLAVELDSTERKDIPPFGGSIDYLTFGGIYRDVSLRIVPAWHIENIFARAKDVLTAHPGVDVACFVTMPPTPPAGLNLEVDLLDGDRVIGKARRSLDAAPDARHDEANEYVMSVNNLSRIQLWDLKNPRLYTVVVRLMADHSAVIDQDRRRIGFREARFTDHGFELNGKVVKLRGLNRHQTFPWVGQAMPARAQRRDAWILKRELKLNIVRTSHYPQSPHFLDACDELGLLVLEEIPGWQHVGDQAWEDLAVDNVRRMIRRDWNHPSIILWGVRINESQDNHDFYTRTNALAHQLDSTRPTGGIRYNYNSELLEDVFTMNDFGFPLKPPNHPLYLNTEFIGHTYPTKMNDTGERLTEHSLRHARVHNQIGSDAQYAGGIGWCAFDYDTHNNFGAGDRVCYHGVSDIFRLPKPAAFFYKAQGDPAEEIVLEPCFQWSAKADWPSGLGVRAADGSFVTRNAVVWSNCDHLEFYVGEKMVAEADPDRTNFPNLPHPPFQVDLNRNPSQDLRIEGYAAGKRVIEKKYPSKGFDQQFALLPDDITLIADGADATRIVMKVTDEFGNLLRYSTSAIALAIDGPAEIIGDNPFSLMGGCGAVWVRAGQRGGTVRLKATHPFLGLREVEIKVVAAEPERV